MPPRRRTARPTSLAEWPAAAGGSLALASLLDLAERYGAPEPLALIDPEALARPAAARRALLHRLRTDATLAPPPLGTAERLEPPPRPGNTRSQALAALEPDERLLLAGALLDGLDVNALAHGTRSNAKAVKASARRLLAKLDASMGGPQALDGVAMLMAGEYALGLLPPGAQVLFERGLALDPELQRCVDSWDARLASLMAPTPADTALEPALAATAPPRSTTGPSPRRRRPWLALLAVSMLVAVPIAWSFVDPSTPVWTPVTTAEDDLPDARLAQVALPTFDPVQAVSVPAADAADPTLVGTPPRAPQGQRAVETVPPVLASTEVVADTLLPQVSARLIVLYGNDGDTAARASKIAEELELAGVEIAMMSATGTTISHDRVRFFFDEDADTASNVQRALAGMGAPPDVQDFTHYRPLPSPGTLEVWLAAKEP